MGECNVNEGGVLEMRRCGVLGLGHRHILLSNFLFTYTCIVPLIGS